MLFVPFWFQIRAAFVIFLFVANYTLAKPTSNGSTDELREFKLDDISKGIYSFRFVTPENIIREEKGHFDDDGNLVIDGFYSYVDPDGNTQYVSYHADKDGYHINEIPEISPVAAPGIDPNVVASLLG